MPIRMVEDDNQEQQQFNDDNNNNDSGGGGGQGSGGGPGLGTLLGFLPILFGLFRNRPILLVFFLVVGGFFYFKGCNFLGGNGGNSDTSMNTGCQMNQKIYDQAEVFESLNPDKTPLPEATSLERFAPRRGDQGQQGSCVGWGSSYGARTILQATTTGQNPDDIVFSPSYLYNTISLQGCDGSYIFKAMEVLTKEGVLPLKDFRYNDRDCDTKPDARQKTEAAQYKMRGYQRLTSSGDKYDVDFQGVRQNIAAGAPVVIGMTVTKTFTYDMMGRKVWHPTQAEYDGQGSLGGHCMCVIGYDDRIEGGAFQIMNSWSPKWGENGLAWVRYKDFLHFTKEAYGLYPMAKRGDAANKQFACAIGLVDVSNKQYMPLLSAGGNLFKTIKPVTKGAKFKIEVKNTVECYTYLFGQETDNSSYVLFPYTPKHSAFCGITGYRLFPKDYSLQPDQVGNKDFMAIVVTKQAIDYKQLNNTINASKQATYQGKINEALGSIAIKNVRFTNNNNTFGFETTADEKSAVAIVLEVNKQ